MQIKSTFAVLDVKSGRADLAKMFSKRGAYSEAKRVPVLIQGYIDGIWSEDDGVSREFSVTVTGVKATAPGLLKGGR
jgi:hypothetical protein